MADRVRFARFSDGDKGIKLVFAPLHIALARGYFRDVDLDVELVTPQERFGWLELVHDRADIGAGFFTFPAQEAYRGTLKVVAVHERHVPGCGFTALMARPRLIKRGELSDYRSLKGKKIGLLPGRGDDYLAFHGALRQGGLTIGDVEIVPVPHAGPARIEAVRCARVDVVIARRPIDHFEAQVQRLLSMWKRGFEVRPHFQAQYFLANARFCDEKTELGARFFAAYLRGARDFIREFVEGADKQGMIDLLVEQTDDSRATISALYPVWFCPDGRVDRAALAADRALLIEADLFPAEVSVDQLVDDRLVAGALQQIGPFADSLRSVA